VVLPVFFRKSGAFDLLATQQRLGSAAGSAKAKTDAPGLGQSKSRKRGQ
jgi:hypothetical protein